MAVAFEDVCRDYLRNVCTRGKKCRYKHPQGPSLELSPAFNPLEERDKLRKSMCHDFQNTTCFREGCKYIHSSKEDVERFMETGSLSAYVLEDAIAKSVIPYFPGEAPVCRDYLSGECRRGKTCKFRHLSHCKYRKELDMLFSVETSAPESPPPSAHLEAKRLKKCQSCVSHGGEVCLPHSCAQGYVALEKCNSYYHASDRCQVITNHSRSSCLINYSAETCFERNSETPTYTCDDEITRLKKQIIDLKKQVSDLAAANEFLLEQNATLRISRKNSGVVAIQPQTPATIVTGPAMNVQPATGQLVAVSGQNAPTQQIVAAAVPVSIAPGGAQMTLSTGNAQQLVPVSCHAIAAVSSVTVAGQTGGNPTLLAAAVPVSQQQLVPVSVSSTASQLVSMSAVPVSLSAMSMAPIHMPPIVTAASGPPHSIAMSVSPATPLVSYPVMTQHLLPTR